MLQCAGQCRTPSSLQSEGWLFGNEKKLSSPCTLGSCLFSTACAEIAISALSHPSPPALSYGFVTYRYAEEAFAAIESGHKLGQADEQPFDLCFGGRRQFCKRSYSDLGEWRRP